MLDNAKIILASASPRRRENCWLRWEWILK